MQDGVQLSHGGVEGDPFLRTGDDPAHAEGLCLTDELSANCRRRSWCALEVATSVEKPAHAGGPCRTIINLDKVSMSPATGQNFTAGAEAPACFSIVAALASLA